METILEQSDTMTKKSPIRALIFDMDGLLVDSETQAHTAITAFVKGHGHELNEEVGSRLLGKRLTDAMVILRDAFNIETPVEEMTATYGEMRLAALRGTVKPMPGAVEIIAFGRK